MICCQGAVLCSWFCHVSITSIPRPSIVGGRYSTNPAKSGWILQIWRISANLPDLLFGGRYCWKKTWIRRNPTKSDPFFESCKIWQNLADFLSKMKTASWGSFKRIQTGFDRIPKKTKETASNALSCHGGCCWPFRLPAPHKAQGHPHARTGIHPSGRPRANIRTGKTAVRIIYGMGSERFRQSVWFTRPIYDHIRLLSRCLFFDFPIFFLLARLIDLKPLSKSVWILIFSKSSSKMSPHLDWPIFIISHNN